MNYKVESDFVNNGYRCVVVMTGMGHRCGYVGIPKNHPLHGVDYSEKASVLKTAEMQEIPLENAGLGQMLKGMMGEYENEEISPEMYFNVHGGITYSGGGNYPVESDGLWWYGYDCAHSGDAKDLNAIDDIRVRDLERKYHVYGVVRTKDYCEQECKNLAEQLKQVQK